MDICKFDVYDRWISIVNHVQTSTSDRSLVSASFLKAIVLAFESLMDIMGHFLAPLRILMVVEEYILASTFSSRINMQGNYSVILVTFFPVFLVQGVNVGGSLF